MGLFDWLTGGGKTADKVIDKVSSGIDYAFYTDQEKAEDGKKRLDWILEYMKATAPQNVSRRFIAVVVTLLWALLILLAVGLHLADLAAKAEFVFKTLKEQVQNPFLTILGFYFLKQVVQSWKGS